MGLSGVKSCIRFFSFPKVVLYSIIGQNMEVNNDSWQLLCPYHSVGWSRWCHFRWIWRETWGLAFLIGEDLIIITCACQTCERKQLLGMLQRCSIERRLVPSFAVGSQPATPTQRRSSGQHIARAKSACLLLKSVSQCWTVNVRRSAWSSNSLRILFLSFFYCHEWWRETLAGWALRPRVKTFNGLRERKVSCLILSLFQHTSNQREKNHHEVHQSKPSRPLPRFIHIAR